MKVTLITEEVEFYVNWRFIAFNDHELRHVSLNSSNLETPNRKSEVSKFELSKLIFQLCQPIDEFFGRSSHSCFCKYVFSNVGMKSYLH